MFDSMRTGSCLDLETRPGKAPGGYQYQRQQSRLPFIFMNAAGLQRDLTTMVHEAGHAFHSLLSKNDPILAYRGTWLDMFKLNGDELGFSDLSKSIVSGSAGRLSVFDKAVEQKILRLREDPEASAKFAAVYARDNASTLGQNLNRDLDATDLYLAHFLGASGASQILSADDTAPNIYASHVVPDAAKANRSIFFSETGPPRTV